MEFSVENTAIFTLGIARNDIRTYLVEAHTVVAHISWAVARVAQQFYLQIQKPGDIVPSVVLRQFSNTNRHSSSSIFLANTVFISAEPRLVLDKF